MDLPDRLRAILAEHPEGLTVAELATRTEQLLATVLATLDRMADVSRCAPVSGHTWAWRLATMSGVTRRGARHGTAAHREPTRSADRAPGGAGRGVAERSRPARAAAARPAPAADEPPATGAGAGVAAVAGGGRVARCRVCGCTDDDCRGCIARTGAPCSWAEPDLCTACVPAPATIVDEPSPPALRAILIELATYPRGMSVGRMASVTRLSTAQVHDVVRAHPLRLSLSTHPTLRLPWVTAVDPPAPTPGAD